MQRIRRSALWFVACAVLVALPATPQQFKPLTPPAAQTPTLAPPLPGGPAPDLDLVFTGQVVGYVEPCG